MDKAISDAVIKALEDTMWRDSDDVQPEVFKFFCGHFTNTCIIKKPQSYAEAYTIIQEYDKVWRRAAVAYHESFGKVVLDFEHFLTSLVPIIREHYDNPNPQAN